MQETWVRSLGQEDRLENGMATHSSILAWDKKIRDTKGIFHAKMGSIKDRNCMDLPEAEDIKKRWQEYQASSPFLTPTAGHPGNQASSRGEAKNSAVLLRRDAGLLEPPERPQGSPASSSVWWSG